MILSAYIIAVDTYMAYRDCFVHFFHTRFVLIPKVV